MHAMRWLVTLERKKHETMNKRKAAGALAIGGAAAGAIAAKKHQSGSKSTHKLPAGITNITDKIRK